MTKPKPYLILHKVRGEPAWDIAEPANIGDERGWIVPTSGHRAYPVIFMPLDSLYPIDGIEPDVVANLPDHYAVNDKVAPVRDKPKPLDVDDIFAALGASEATNASTDGHT